MNELQLCAVDNFKKELSNTIQWEMLQQLLQLNNLLSVSEYETIKAESPTSVGRFLYTLNMIKDKNGSWDLLIQYLRENSYFNLASRIEMSVGVGKDDKSMEQQKLLDNSSADTSSTTPRRPSTVTYQVPLESEKKRRRKTWDQQIPCGKRKLIASCAAALAILVVAIVCLTVVLAKPTSEKNVVTSSNAAGPRCANPTVKAGKVIVFPCTTADGPNVCSCNTAKSKGCMYQSSTNGGYCDCLFGGADCVTNGDCCNYECITGQCKLHGGDQGSICVPSDISPGRISGCKDGCTCVDYFFDDSIRNRKETRGYCKCV